MAKYNDLDMKKWKDYSDIFTESLWLIEKRDNSEGHSASYHGNFVPQIPYQMLRRYTKKGDWVLDPFMGSGTTLIEAKKMGRNAIGIEIQEKIAEEVAIKMSQGSFFDSPSNKTEIVVGDSKKVDLKEVLDKYQIEKVDFIIYHPPYWDIIKFSDKTEDSCNSKSLEDFLENLDAVIENTIQHLSKDRYCAIVIGDKYANSQLIPLGFYCMNLFTKYNLTLKAIIVKNFEETKGKANQRSLWRYRALSSDYYTFKHEYIMIFKK